MKKSIIVLVMFLIIGAAFLLNGINQKSETKKKEINDEVVFDKEGLLQDVQIGESVFKETGKMTLENVEGKEEIAKAEELEKIKEEHQIVYSIYQSDKEKEGKTDLLVVFRNKGNQLYSKELKFPCEDFLTVHQPEEWESNQKKCKEEQASINLFELAAGSEFYITTTVELQQKEEKLYIETPFGLKQATIIKR